MCPDISNTFDYLDIGVVMAAKIHHLKITLIVVSINPGLIEILKAHIYRDVQGRCVVLCALLCVSIDFVEVNKWHLTAMCSK